MKSDGVAIPLGKLEVSNATIDGMYGVASLMDLADMDRENRFGDEDVDDDRRSEAADIYYEGIAEAQAESRHEEQERMRRGY